MQNDLNSLHEKAVELAGQFHLAELQLIEVLQKIDAERVYSFLGYGSLFDYAVRGLKLSEANASNFITVARKSKHIPELKEAIKKGELTVSKARKIIPVLTKENSAHWIKLAIDLPKPKLEKEVARVMPQVLTPERAKYVTENRLELKLGLSETSMKRLRRAQDLVSQKKRKAANLEDTLNELLEFFLERQDPYEKARRAKVKSGTEENLRNSGNGVGESLKNPENGLSAGEVTADSSAKSMGEVAGGAKSDTFIWAASKESLGQTTLDQKQTAQSYEEPLELTTMDQSQTTKSYEELLELTTLDQKQVSKSYEKSQELSILNQRSVKNTALQTDYDPMPASFINTFNSSQIYETSFFDAHASVPGTHDSSVRKNRFLPAHLKHDIHLRDEARCTFRDLSGHRCESQRWLDVHHKIPVSKGGANTLENLETLCFAHHRQRHHN